MELSSDILNLKKRIVVEVNDYFTEHRPENCNLLLDSTGPSFTRQYIVLNQIGLQRLHAFNEIHAFSGAVYALFGYIAFATGKNRVSIDTLCAPEAELVFRNQHHAGRVSGLRSIVKMITGRPAFDSVDPLVISFEYIFGQYAEQPFSSFPDNIFLYLAKSKQEPLLVLSNNARCSPELHDLRAMPIKNIIAMAANVPMVYGGVQPAAPYFDPVYTAHYLPTLKQITATEKQTLISTPWRSGQSGNRHYLNCYPRGNPRWLMLKDFTRLVTGQRNVSWSRDIYTAFKAGDPAPEPGIT